MKPDAESDPRGPRHRRHFVSVSGLALQIVLWTAALASLVGVAAPAFAPAELANHFRPFVILYCLAVLPIAFWLRRRAVAQALAALCLVNILLCSLVILTRADPADPRNGWTYKIVSFNMEFSGGNDDRIFSYLDETKPDFVVFQEVPLPHANTLFARLKDAFPSQMICPPKSGCALGLLARQPILASGHQGRTEAAPPQVWAEFSRPQGSPLRVIGVHLAIPLTAFRQARHIEALARETSERRQPVIIAGDFNLTPWSWLLNKLAWQGHLRRHGLLAVSWPSDRRFGTGPFLLLDNVMASAEIKNVSFTAGPHLGSDHRPVAAALLLP